MTEERKLQIPVEVDATGAKAGFDQIKAGGLDMAQSLQQSGQQAGAGLDAGIVASVKRASEATKQGASAVKTWQEVHNAAMAKAAADWNEYKASVKSGAAPDTSGLTTWKQFHERGMNDARAQWNAYKETVKSAGAAVGQAAGSAANGVSQWTAQQARLLQQGERESIMLEKGKVGWLEHRAAILGVSDAFAPYATKMRQAEQGQAALGMSAKQTAFALRGVPAQFTDIFVSLQSGQRPMQVLLQQGGQLKDMFGGIGPAARALGGYIVGLVNPFTIAAGAIGAIAFAANEGDKELRGFQNAATLTGNAIGVTNSRFSELRDSIGEIATKGKAAEVLTEIAKNGRFTSDSIAGIAEAAILMEKATGQATAKTIEQFAELAKSPADAAAKLNEQYNFLTASVYKQIKALEDQGRAMDAANLAERTYADALETRARSVVENAGLMEKAWRGVAGGAKWAWDQMLGVGRTQTLAERLSAVQAEIAKASGPFNAGAFGGNAEARAKLAGNKVLEADLQEQIRIEKRLAESQAERAQITRQTVEWEKQGEQFLTKQEQRERELTKATVEGQQLVNAGIIKEQDLRKRLDGIRQKYNDNSGASDVAAQRAAKIVAQQEAAMLQKQIDSLDFTTPTKLTDAEKKVILIQEQLKESILGVARANKERELATAQAAVQDEKARASAQSYAEALKAGAQAHQQQITALANEAARINEVAAGQEQANAMYGKSKTAIEQAALAQMKLNAAEAEAARDWKLLAALDTKTKAQERYVKALQDAEYIGKSHQMDEAARVSMEETATLELQVRLLGVSQQEREKIVAIRRVEVALAKELADIDKLNLGEGPEAEAKRVDLREKAKAKAVIDANNATTKSVLDEWQRTSDSINQSLTDALLRGFESGKDFARNLRDTLANMFKTLVLRQVIKGVLAPVSGALAGLGQSVTGGGGSAVSGLGMSPYLNTVGSALGYASAIKSASEGAWGNAAGTALGTYVAGPLGAVIGSAIGSAIDKAFGGETRSGAEYVNGTKLRGPSGGEIGGDQTRAAIQSTQDAINATLRSMGSSATVGEFASGLESSGKGKGFAYAGGTLSTGASFGQSTSAEGRDNRRGSMSPEEASAAFAEELKQATLQALQAADVPGQLGDYLRQLGDIDKLSGGALDAALARINKALTEKDQLEAQIFAMTATSLEQLTKARDKERAAIDSSNAALLEHVYALQDQQQAATVLVDAYNREKDALQQTIDRHRDYAKQLREFRDGLMISDSSPLGAQDRTRVALSQYDQIYARAQAGDLEAIAGLQGASTNYLSALKASAASAAEYNAGFSKVMSGLTLTAAASDAAATVGQSQLSVAAEQLTQLGLINTNLVSFQDALAGYLAAVANTKSAADAAAAIAAAPAATPETQTVWSKLHDRIDETIKKMGSGSGSGAILGMDLSSAGFSFAGGGLASGWAMVGEEGPELVNFSQPGRVYTASQTIDALSSDSSSATAEAIQRLNEKVERLIEAASASAKHSYNAAKTMDQINVRGVQIRDRDDQTVPNFHAV